MNILPAGSGDPVGAAALLDFADPPELERFTALENAVWGRTTLTPAVIEAVRLHCAQTRGCKFCAAVRTTAATEDGLSEDHIARLSSREARDGFAPAQAAALQLADHFLLDPRRPAEPAAAKIAAILGTAGIMEVLLACCAFASADLRIALGENREPYGSGIVHRTSGRRASRAVATAWPALDGPVLDPHTRMPAVDRELARPFDERREALWSGRDISPAQVAACVIRSAQLRSAAEGRPDYEILVPVRAARLADPEAVRHWHKWRPSPDRHLLALAEQTWLDPSGISADITAPLVAILGVEGIIRVTWQLILIGQLHRLALVLHRNT
ncbi:MAG: carboxymuconolactone decarboxylase family protein [Gammaproteobacteria bacterium]|nr:carboxymuconolactone decarboxylase family protein [Gammaproteobacteria bacterium]MDH5311514.1 carboxymuconolactone decarboxylase family protein [Gammaproteobacteria bacterium]